ncbi:MAG: inositol monophosphatase [Candidatus Omnitrophica bacterium]|nr:inositol monophosphatase [Candidatus Omnitrophota bacterium]
MSKILDLGIAAAKEAGEFLLDGFGKVSKIEKKGDRDFATNLDKEAELMIIDKIKAQFPSHGILAEETGNSDLDSEYIWIIDPLDGTHNFIRNIDIFGVSIGIVHKQKDFVAGIIYMPSSDELYIAERGSGAYKNDTKILVSENNDLKECSIAFDSSIRYTPGPMLGTLGDLAEKVFNIRMFGSSARHLSYVAEGVLDFVVEFHDRPWDFAGGVCIIEEAGGFLSDLRGERLTYKTIGYIASNNRVHGQIEDIVRSNLKLKR